MTKSILSQKRLKELLHYDPDTGLFTRLNGMMAGREAGADDIGRRLTISLKCVSYKAHRLAWLYMTGYWPDEIDHINHNPHDNRWPNIRNATHTCNMTNKSLYKKNRTGINGVRIRRNLYSVHIGIKGKCTYVGSFIDFFDACCARKSAEYRYGYHENHGT